VKGGAAEKFRQRRRRRKDPNECNDEDLDVDNVDPKGRRINDAVRVKTFISLSICL
jgi:hypothetical protein